MTTLERNIIFALFAAFLAVFVAMHFGYLASFDDALLRFSRQIDEPSLLRGGGKLSQAVIDFTALGGLTVLFSLTAIISLYFIVVGKTRFGWSIAASILSGWMVSASVKLIVGRERPDVVPHLIPVHDASFPSGHAMLSAVTYLTLGLLLGSVQKTAAARRYVIAIAMILTFLVGSSRIFLGVHFPTDVIAGWLLGGAWAMLCYHIVSRYNPLRQK